MRPPICCRIFAAFLLLFTFAQPASSQLTFPLAASDAAGARQQFNQRAETIIRTNACGREHDYARIRQEQKDGEYDHQGEDLLAILIAKGQWLLKRQDPCVAKVDIERPRKPDGTFEHATLE